MDQEDAEEAAKEAAEGADAQSTSLEMKTENVNSEGTDKGNVPDSTPPPAKVQVKESGVEATSASSTIQATPTTAVDETVSISESMDMTSNAKGAGKRLRDDVEDRSQDTDGAGTERPPQKTQTGRRSTLKVKLNVPPDRRLLHGPPPP